MSKQTINVFVHFKKNYMGADEFVAYPFDMTGHDAVLVSEQQVEIDVPDDFNPIAVQVEMLKKEREQVVENSTRSIKRIDDQIANLMCLTNEVTA